MAVIANTAATCELFLLSILIRSLYRLERLNVIVDATSRAMIRLFGCCLLGKGYNSATC